MKLTLNITALCTLLSFNGLAQNALNIPPALTGTNFNLDVQTGTMSFYPGTTTPTYGINGAFLSPTIVVNKGDSITLNVMNNLPVKTTMHWHGLHVSPENDGGPHQSIPPGATWSPSFKVRNNASTFWYHPHGAGQTDPQVSRGLAGMFIIHDPLELALNIPHEYGVDDIPLIVQTKDFDVLYQTAIATQFDTAIMVNGTLDAQFNAPAQVVRFRILNGSSMRSYNFGLSNNQTMYQIGTDGGLLDTTLAISRIILAPGERAEVLVDFSGMNGDSLYLKSYASEFTDGIYGAAVLGSGADTVHEYYENPLNGADFDIMKIKVVSATANPVTSVPTALVPLVPFDPAMATNDRTILFDTLRLLPADVPNRAEGPFGINHSTFNMDSINEVVYLNTMETWTLINSTLVAHPFHIHDIQFNIIREHGQDIPAKKRGWKDVVLVMPGDTVKVLTKFETFADNHIPYMYHCHLLHHEDDGMMGTFLVIDSNSTSIKDLDDGTHLVQIYPNPANNIMTIDLAAFTAGTKAKMEVKDISGRVIYEKGIFAKTTHLPIGSWASGMYLINISDGKFNATRKVIVQHQ